MSHSSRLWSTAMIVFTLSIWPALAQPVGAQVLTFGTGVGFPGDVVTITATLDTQGSQISALGGDIQFDPNAFSARGCSLSPAITQKSLAINLVQPNVQRFILFGLNQGVVPNGVLFNCKFLILPSALTLPLSVPTLDAADPLGNGVRLAPGTGRIVVLSASAKSGGGRNCNLNTCGSAIANCEISHGCDQLRGAAAASCRRDCRQGVVAVCHEDRDLSVCD